MAKVFAAYEICKLSLGRVGRFSLNDAAPRAQDMDRALLHLDTMLANLTGVETIWWLVPATIDIPLDATTGTYDLLNAMGADVPVDGFLYPIKAMLDLTGDGTNLVPVDIITREAFDGITNQAASGQPSALHIDRTAVRPTMRINPIPDSTQTSFVLKLTFQTLSPQVANDGLVGRQGAGNVKMGFRPTWNLWADYQLSAIIGDGPCARRPRADISAWWELANDKRDELLAFENKEHEDSPSQTLYRDY